jgi:hypothetical protein
MWMLLCVGQLAVWNWSESAAACAVWLYVMELVVLFSEWHVHSMAELYVSSMSLERSVLILFLIVCGIDRPCCCVLVDGARMSMPNWKSVHQNGVVLREFW